MKTHKFNRDQKKKRVQQTLEKQKQQQNPVVSLALLPIDNTNEYLYCSKSEIREWKVLSSRCVDWLTYLPIFYTFKQKKNLFFISIISQNQILKSWSQDLTEQICSDKSITQGRMFNLLLGYLAICKNAFPKHKRYTCVLQGIIFLSEKLLFKIPYFYLQSSTSGPVEKVSVFLKRCVNK